MEMTTGIINKSGNKVANRSLPCFQSNWGWRTDFYHESNQIHGRKPFAAIFSSQIHGRKPFAAVFPVRFMVANRSLPFFQSDSWQQTVRCRFSSQIHGGEPISTIFPVRFMVANRSLPFFQSKCGKNTVRYHLSKKIYLCSQFVNRFFFNK
jgi:hypothetical protein